MLSRRVIAVDRQLLTPKAFYLLYFLAGAFFGPFLPLYYREVGMTGRQIGMLGAVIPLVTLLSGPLWGGLADATRLHRWLLTLTIASALITVPAIFMTRQVLLLSALVVVNAFLRSPTMPLVDSAMIRILGERRNLYGQQRLWGTIGYSIGGVCVGALTQRLGLHAAFYGFLPLMLGALLLSLRLPAAEYRRGVPFWRGLRTLFTNRQWAIFLIAVFIAGLGQSGSHRFLFLHLSDLGASNTLIGLSMFAEGVGEVPVFFYAHYLMHRWSKRTLLIFAWAVYIVRLLVLSAMRAPWVILPIQLVLGVAFSAMWSTGVSLTSEMAPEGMGATAQAVYSAMRGGLASAAGAFLGGIVFDRWGGPVLFRCGALAIMVALLFFMAADRGAVSLRRGVAAS
jgi:PPP family 3-phenylpropionic acid transporter